MCFFFNRTPTPKLFTLSLHDALPISSATAVARCSEVPSDAARTSTARPSRSKSCPTRTRVAARSEEHTSELQSHVNLVCRLLLEKKKTGQYFTNDQTNKFPLQPISQC